MVTTVGTESTMDKLVKNLLLLEHDAIAAYDSTIEKLDDAAAKTRIAEFREDHVRHVAGLRAMATALGVEPPTEGDAKEHLTTGKVSLASIVGDGAILRAMKTNEDDTVTAYERASGHAEATPDARDFFEAAAGDERRHRAYMNEAAAAR